MLLNFIAQVINYKFGRIYYRYSPKDKYWQFNNQVIVFNKPTQGPRATIVHSQLKLPDQHYNFLSYLLKKDLESAGQAVFASLFIIS